MNSMLNRLLLMIAFLLLSAIAQADDSSDKAIYDKGETMGRIAATAEICGLPRPELKSRSRWVVNWMSKLPREQKEYYGAGIKAGSLDVRVGGIRMSCASAIEKLRERTNELNY